MTIHRHSSDNVDASIWIQAWANGGVVVVGQGPGAAALNEAPEEAVTQEAGGRVGGAVGIGARKLLSCHLAARTVTRAPKVKPREEGGAGRINGAARRGCGRYQGRGGARVSAQEAGRQRRRVSLSAHLHVTIIIVVGVIFVLFSLDAFSNVVYL